MYTKDQERLLQELVEEFNRTNEWHITVRAEYAGYFSDIRKKILDSLAAGVPPDLAIAFPNQVAEYQQYGIVEPLDDYVGSVRYGLTPDDLADIFSTILESDRYPTYENRLLSFPPSRSMEVLYYNMDWLEALGYETPPETWEQFRSLCIAASGDTDGDGIRDAYGYALDVNHYVLENWIWSYGGSLTSDDYKQAAFHNSEGVAALTFLTELVSSGYAYQVSKRYDDQSAFATQKALFTTGTSAGIPYYTQQITDPKTRKPRFRWAVAPIPHNTTEPVVIIHGPSIVLFKSTPQRQLASWLFIRWFTQPENNARWAMATNYFPLRKSALALDVMKDYIKNNPAYATAAEFLSYARAEPRIAAWYQVQELLAEAMREALNGTKSPKQALDDAAREANGLLSQ
ncbi:MAG: ABC transporter substrate-binding protein [Chloroflexi bacterium]|nr:ABC transporter substrate-binding protein [Chloroflexota bacterium]